MSDVISQDPYTQDLSQAAALLQNAPWRRFAVLGDSHAAGIRERLDGYPDRSWYDWVSGAFQSAHADFASHNFGKKGLLTREVRAKQLAPALDYAPDLAVVLCGGNDILRGSLNGVEPEFDQMLTPLRARGCTVITMGLFDITKSARVPEAYRSVISAQLTPMYEIIERVAARHSTLHLNFGVHPACVEENIYATDNMHLTVRGHAVVAATVVRALSELTARSANTAVLT
jgi:lysophospholipase L1-like esterase